MNEDKNERTYEQTQFTRSAFDPPFRRGNIVTERKKNYLIETLFVGKKWGGQY